MAHSKRLASLAACFLSISITCIPTRATPDKVMGVSGAEIFKEDIAEYYPTGKAYAVCHLNVRASPDISSQVTRTLEQGEEVTVKRYSGDWAALEDGYCYTGYLSSSWKPNGLDISADSLDSARYIGYAYSQFLSLPDVVLSCLTEYKVMVTEGPIVDHYGQEGIEAVGRTYTDGKDNKMWLAASVDAMQDTLFHESGHVLDHSGMLKDGLLYSEYDGFQYAYEKEQQEFSEFYNCLEYNTYSRQEYFAESFKQYLSDGDTLKDNFPETYQFHKQLVEKLSH